jgi:hypothetical protein
VLHVTSLGLKKLYKVLTKLLNVRKTELTLHCKDSIPKIRIFQEMKLRGLSLNSYIHVSVSDLYISTIGQPILLQENRWTNLGNI